MKELPILFSTPMVRAILDGSKTQTRRVVKPQPIESHKFDGGAYLPQPKRTFTPQQVSGEIAVKADYVHLCCPYGKPGDQLWVRETFFAYGRWETRYSAKKGRDEWHFIDMTLECDRIYQYAADNPDVPLAKGHGPLPGWYKRPAIHMPRRACRMAPEIVSVRVERLNDISEADASAEGIKSRPVRSGVAMAPVTIYGLGADNDWCSSAAHAFQELWGAINGAESWDANPWVWVVEFKRVMHASLGLK